MSDILELVAKHDVGIGLAGTLIIVLAVIVGIGRQNRRGPDQTSTDSRRK